MKRATALLTALTAVIMMCSCGNESGDTSSAEDVKQSAAGESAAESIPDEDQDPPVISCKAEDQNFEIYTSNTYLSTGNNGIVRIADEITYRAYIPVEEYGELEYCFYFSNSVDSTYNKGNPAYVGKEGGEYTISSAAVYDGGESPEDEVTGKTEITFGGETKKEVSPCETFWSDPVALNIPEGHYLVWEWTLTGRDIPCISMSDLSSSVSDKGGTGEFIYCSDIPLPVFIGAKRENVSNRVMAVGDSITQGCQTEFMKYEYWAAQIAKQLGDSSSFWNCGLGWARTSDLSSCNNWLGRSLNCDTAIVAFGTNDIISGEYNGDGGNSAQEIVDYLTVVLDQFKAAGVKNIILFNAPPQNYDEEHEAVRTEYNEMLRQTAEEYGAYYFDFASYLCDPETPAEAKYGGHPNGEAGKIVADAFMEQFGDMLK
ncbi:MAG: SGNH/GDSL hydrolase family protein [Ruminococcus sp.]|nr:SGNH/GDSL hydrolase family protein [Ruminococcus sp.]